VALGERDDAIHVWDVREGKEVRQIKDVKGRVETLLFSPDSTVLACTTEPVGNARGKSMLCLWDVASGKERRTFANDTLIGGIAFSPDGKVLAIGDWDMGVRGEPLVRLWDTATGKELGRYGGHRKGSVAVAFSADGKLVASAGNGNYEDNSIHVWEAATGRLIRRFDSHTFVFVVKFAADGLTVASNAGDSTILLCDITGQQKDGKLSPAALTPRQLDACWTVLANEDAAKAYDAVWMLVASGEQSVPSLQKHLRPVSRPDAEMVSRLIADLDSDYFNVRQHAMEELSKLGDTITPTLRQALDGKPALEVGRRLQQLLDRSRDWTPERLREHRALQALEHIGTAQAKEVLEALAAGAPGACRTTEAKAVLRRLSH
jgi:hypothetical protein